MIELKRFHCLTVILIMSICALAQAPEVDISFSGTGRTISNITPGEDQGKEVLIQSDGKIVVAGYTSDRFFGLTRFNTDGTIDTTFGVNGVTLTDFSTQTVTEIVSSAAIQPDDKIVVAGSIRIISPGEGYYAVARYNADGSIDTSFGSQGKVTTSFNTLHLNEATDVSIAPDGHILVAGYYFENGLNFQTGIIRLSPDGSGGLKMRDRRGIALGATNVANAVKVRPDGKIVTAGAFDAREGALNNDITMVRYNVDGTYDQSFASSGRYTFPSQQAESLLDLELLPDGKMVACGSAGSDFLLMRFDSNGIPDPTFAGNDGNGRVKTPMGGFAEARKLIVRPNGKILVIGASSGNLALAYYNEDGTLDTSFSGDGKLTFNFTGASTVANSVAIDSIGRIVLGGSSTNSGDGVFAAVRLYTLDPVPVTVIGRALTPAGNPVRSMEVFFTDPSGVSRYTLTTSLGYFQFDGIPTGQTYTLSVSSKKYLVQNRQIALNEAINDLQVLAVPNEGLANGKGSKNASPFTGGDRLDQNK